MKDKGLLILGAIAVGIGVFLAYAGSRPVDAREDIEAAERFFDSCKNVTFMFHNDGKTSFEVKKVKYFNQNKGKWKTESVNLSNHWWVCPSNTTCTTSGDNLSDAEGDTLSKIVFVMKGGPDYKEYDSQEFHPTKSGGCRRDITYGSGDWNMHVPEVVQSDGGGGLARMFRSR